MSLIIEKILSLEEEADKFLTEARTEAKVTEKSADEKMRAVRENIDAQVDARLAAFRQQTEEKFAQDLEKSKGAAQKALDELTKADAVLIESQAKEVVKRFCEL